MLSFIAKRLIATLPVMLMVAIVVFAILRLTPGDPAALLAGDLATADQLQDIRHRMGLDNPLHIQFIQWISQLIQGNLGVSLISDVPVSEMILNRVGPTISISISTIVFSVLV